MLFKKLFTIFCLFAAGILCGQITNVPDTNFEQSLIDQGIDSDGILNGQVFTADIENLIMLDVFGEDIQDFTGIEDFVALEFLDCSRNHFQGALDLSSNINLEVLYASDSEIQAVDISGCPSLVILYINDNELINLDISNNPLLEEVRLGNESEDVFPFNEFVTLDFSANPQLQILDCFAIQTLTNVILDGATDLRFANFSACGLTSIDVSTNLLLEEFIVGYISASFSGTSNNLASIDVTNNPNLTSLYVANTDISSLDLRNGANDILIGMGAIQTPNLSCILVDDETAATNGDAPYGSWPLDAGTQFSETECTIGVEDYLLETIEMFPNPVVDILTIQYNEQLVMDTITIYDILGKKMFVVRDDFSGAVDMQLLPSGVYFVRMEIGDAVLTKKVLKK